MSKLVQRMHMGCIHDLPDDQVCLTQNLLPRPARARQCKRTQPSSGKGHVKSRIKNGYICKHLWLCAACLISTLASVYMPVHQSGLLMLPKKLTQSVQSPEARLRASQHVPRQQLGVNFPFAQAHPQTECSVSSCVCVLLLVASCIAKALRLNKHNKPSSRLKQVANSSILQVHNEELRSSEAVQLRCVFSTKHAEASTLHLSALPPRYLLRALCLFI